MNLDWHHFITLYSFQMSELNAWWIPMEPYWKDGKSKKSNPADDVSFLLGSYIDLPTLRSNKACDDTNKRTMTHVINSTDFNQDLSHMATTETNFDRNIRIMAQGGQPLIETWHTMTQGGQLALIHRLMSNRNAHTLLWA